MPRKKKEIKLPPNSYLDENGNIISFYDLSKILMTNAQYYIIYGERSNGKTFAIENLALENFCKTGEQLAIIRRYEIDFIGKRGQTMFNHLVVNKYTGNLVEKYTNGEWTDICYYASRWYLCKYTEKGDRIKMDKPFCYGFSLNSQEHDKSTSYPEITTVLFDEFMTRDYYLPDEFIIFTNVLSTIIRERTNVRIFMCGNTVNRYNPYFKEMGLDNVLKMTQGDIQEYRFAAYKDKYLTIAVEYADSPNKNGKPSDIYFAFSNPKLKMITNGLWEMALYPHLPYKYRPKNIVGTYFIEWEQEILQCEIINIEGTIFTYIHKKTTPIQNDSRDIVFSTIFKPQYNYRRKITKPVDDVGKKILWFYNNDKVFYQDNETGEVVRNYLNWCKQDKGFV